MYCASCSGLPISELELATSAYVLCAIIMYSLWWYKPFGVEHVTLVRDYRQPNFVKIPDRRLVPKREKNLNGYFLSALIGPDKHHNRSFYTHIAFYTVATIFSGIHVVAWNWDFPSPVIRKLWRVSSLVATLVGLYSLLQSLVFGRLGWGVWRERMFISIDMLLIILYCGSRLVLVVLILYSFRSMPVGVYETVDWTTYFP